MANILVVENKKEHSELLKKLFIHSGHEVTIVGSSEDGLRSMLADPPDIIFLDYRKLNCGAEYFLDEFPADYYDIPLILYSALEKELINPAISDFVMQPTVYLQIPFDIDELAKLVDLYTDRIR